MHNEKSFFHDRGARKRFFHWAAGKMTGREAFGNFFGEKDKEYPEEMKKEFAQLFDRSREVMKLLQEERKAFHDKWEQYLEEECAFPDGHHHDHHFGGPCADFPEREHGFHGRRGFGW